MGLRLTSYLGENAALIAADLAAALAARVGDEVEACVATSPDEIADGAADLYWLCGLLTTVLLDSGRLHGEIVAAPVFPDRPGPVYRSVVVATSPIDLQTERAGLVLAVNEPGSWSGHHALRTHLGSLDDFGAVVVTGSHAASIERLLAGEADVAAIDDTIWDFLTVRDHRLARLEVVDHTPPWPAPPFTIDRGVPAPTAAAIRRALLDVAPVGLDRIVAATDADYAPIRRAMDRSETA